MVPDSSIPRPLSAFSAYGIELEYMIVDHADLSVTPIADKLLKKIKDFPRFPNKEQLDWSNELVMHVVELKNDVPTPSLSSLARAFQEEVKRINQILGPMEARLMPTGAHPWMNPQQEAYLWSHDNREIYNTYDRIFNCKSHGWANLQSMHVNLPFADDEEFSQLHAAIRALLPILPAIAASSPIIEDRYTGFMDYRMEAYRINALNIPSITGKVIPETCASRADYQTNILQPMYHDIAHHDPNGVLQFEWLNSRAAIPRFVRNAIEIRILDMQECPRADIAVAAVTTMTVKALYQRVNVDPESFAIDSNALVAVLSECNRHAEQALINSEEYLKIFQYPGKRCTAGELWNHIIEALIKSGSNLIEEWKQTLDVILQQGPLARRILRALGPNLTRTELKDVYKNLCDCLEQGKMFIA